jgi:hypothetical protein
MKRGRFLIVLAVVRGAAAGVARAVFDWLLS